MMVCDECKKAKYCSHECRKLKEQKEKILLEALSKTKVGKMMSIFENGINNFYK